MPVTYSAEQVALIISTLTARDRNESEERLPRESLESHAESLLSRSSTCNTEDNGATTDNLGTFTGTEQSHDPRQKSTNDCKQWSQGQESTSRGTDLPPPPPLKKRGPKPLTDTPVSKRTAQNRVAQRAHRERKEHYVKTLEEKVESLESECKLLRQRNAELQAQLDYALESLSRDKTGQGSLATPECNVPLAASGTHQDFCPTSIVSTPLDDSYYQNIATSSIYGQAVEETLQIPIPQNDNSNMPDLMGSTDLHSLDIQAILDNTDIANVESSGTDWEQFWTAWDSQVPAPNADDDELCCQAAQLHM